MVGTVWHIAQRFRSRLYTLSTESALISFEEGNVTTYDAAIDELDGRILSLFAAEPRIGVLQASRRLGVARGTVQARLDRLEAVGIVAGWAPRISPSALGYGVTAFVTLEIDQG